MNTKNNVATPLSEPEPNEANTPIYCNKCGGEVLLDIRLFRLWINRGIKFKYPKCGSFITSKRVM